MTCSVCAYENLTEPDEIAMQTCAKCARSCGIVPMPPVTRPPAPCLRCGKRKFVHAVAREFTSRTQGEANGQITAPMAIGHAPMRDRMDYDDCNVIDIKRGRGPLEVYVCCGCGFVEWYCPDVARIPIHPNQMTEIVDYDAGGPYR